MSSPLQPSCSGDVAPVHIISLGAGVQSSTMALMAARGEITPMPAFAVFSDTGDEPRDVYLWLERLRDMLPFEVKMARSSFNPWKLSDQITKDDFSQIPSFTRGDNGKPGIGRRQCTRHWKIDPVRRKIREALDAKGKVMRENAVVLWQGISWDEISRMKPSRERFIEHRFPLIDLKMTREHCLAWMSAHGYPEPPKSACVFCPYKDRARWLKDQAVGGEDWEIVRKVDAIIAPRGEFLTVDLKRIDEIDFSKPVPNHEDPRQMQLFNNECEGMCGV